jgi:hypothetical protein
MPQSIAYGHTYAIGLGGRGVLVGSDLSRSIQSSGYALPSSYAQAGMVAAGWNPTIFYPADHAPVVGPVWAQTVAIAGRVGPAFTLYGYAGEVSPLSVFSDVKYVLDLGAAPGSAQVTYGLAADPAPGSPAFQSFQSSTGASVAPAGAVTLEDVRRRAAWGGWIGLVAGVGGGVLLGRRSSHPVAWSIAAGLGLGLLGQAVGAVAAVQLGAMPPASS